MRKVIIHLHMSLDGVVSDPEQWMVALSDDILKAAIDYYDTLDLVIFGSKSYPGLADYWQEAGKTPGSSVEGDFAIRINEIKKLVLSRSSVDMAWENSEWLPFQDTASFSNSIRELKSVAGGNISVESGISVWKLFLEQDLFDELMLYVHPVIAGRGEKIFQDISGKYLLVLENTRVFKNGVTELHYKKK